MLLGLYAFYLLEFVLHSFTGHSHVRSMLGGRGGGACSCTCTCAHNALFVFSNAYMYIYIYMYIPTTASQSLQHDQSHLVLNRAMEEMVVMVMVAMTTSIER